MSDVQPRAYHHGDLARALVDEATALADEGGPGAVVLREVARRAGVSATAAYRHFTGQEDLLVAVAVRAMAGMAESMRAAQDRRPIPRDPARRAVARWRATGEGYVRFAIAHPGLFRTAFACLPAVATAAGGGTAGPIAGSDPYELLCDALDGCVAAGRMSPAARVGADQLCWIGVHGLSVLAIDAALPAEGPDFERLLDRTLDLLTGLLDG